MADRWPTSRQPSVVLDHRAVQHENALLRELVTVYEHLTGLLLQVPDLAELRSFATEILRKLGAQGRQRGTRGLGLAPAAGTVPAAGRARPVPGHPGPDR